MNQPLIERLASIIDRLATLSKDDETLRTDLRALAQYFLEVTEQSAAKPASVTDAASPGPTAAVAPIPPPPALAEPIAERFWFTAVRVGEHAADR